MYLKNYCVYIKNDAGRCFVDKHLIAFKKKLIGLVATHGGTKKDLAASLGVSRSQLDHYLDEKNDTAPNLDTLSRIAEFFDIPVQAFMAPAAPIPALSSAEVLDYVSKRVRALDRFSPESIDRLLRLTDLQVMTLEETILPDLASEVTASEDAV